MSPAIVSDSSRDLSWNVSSAHRLVQISLRTDRMEVVMGKFYRLMYRNAKLWCQHHRLRDCSLYSKSNCLSTHKALVFQCWSFAKRSLQLCDIGLMVLVMVDLHCGCIDVWLKSICSKG